MASTKTFFFYGIFFLILVQFTEVAAYHRGWDHGNYPEHGAWGGNGGWWGGHSDWYGDYGAYEWPRHYDGYYTNHYYYRAPVRSNYYYPSYGYYNSYYSSYPYDPYFYGYNVDGGALYINLR